MGQPCSCQSTSCPPTIDDPAADTVKIAWSQATINGLAPEIHSESSVRHTRATLGAPTLLNSVLAHMWPTLSKYLIQLLFDKVEPAIQEALGSHGHSLTFDRECSFGSEPPRISDQHVSRTSQSSIDGDLATVVLETSAEWNAVNPNIYINYKGYKMGVKSLRFSFSLVTELVGMLERAPLIQGFRVYMINPPTMEIEFGGTLQSMLNTATIKRMVVKNVCDQVAQLLAVPQKFSYLIDDDADVFRISDPRPVGILSLSISKAAHLSGHDFNGLSDPYVSVRVGAEVEKSRVVWKTLNPKFDYKIDLCIYSPENQILQISVLDKDMATEDDFLGKVDFSVLDMINWESSQEHVVDLEDEDGIAGKNGQIWVGAEWRPLVLDPLDVPIDSTYGFFFAGLYCAVDVPTFGVGSEWWVVATCSHMAPNSCLPDKQETPRLQQTVDKHADDTAEVARLRKKIDVCKTYKMSEAHMQELLDISPEDLAALLSSSSTHQVVANLRRTYEWNHAFQFLVHDRNNAVMTFELWKHTPQAHPSRLGSIAAGLMSIGRSTTATTSKMGSCHFKMSDLKNTTQVVELPVEGTEVKLKLRMQRRFVHAPIVGFHSPHK
eukprot:TRINITY_DN12313_c2_g1_i1.p1 TRINITY_DN12313_c2_g1~~TRINITY_DN12313_c2_g1_i1.p1  ORF type:complete len:606 (-),score=89.28 TRINITY_DN12313_c2_g1_i1:262-2079(-)